MSDAGQRETEELYMAKILQQNAGKSSEALVHLMETVKERKTDLMLVQEPPLFE